MPASQPSPRLLLALLSAALLAACGSGSPPATAPSAPALDTLVVTPGQVPREQVWDGVVEAVADTTLAAQTNARVLELPYDVGDHVEKGAVLVRFSNVEQQSGRRGAEAAVSAARAEYRDAEANFKRIDDVHARGLVAQAALDSARARRDAARASLGAAEAGLQSATQQADYTVVTAPFDGVVTRRMVQVGAAVQSGPPSPQPLIALASLDALRVDVVVPQAAVEAIRSSRRAAVLPAHGASDRIEATRVLVFPWADPATHSFRVRVELPPGVRGIYPGMTVKVAFAVGTDEPLLLPPQVLVERGEVRAAYVLAENGAVQLRQLRLGHVRADGVEVLAGLVAGERVITDPAAAAGYLRERHGAGRARP